MKIPSLDIQYSHYHDPKIVNTRYGKGYDGLYFFEVVILVKHGCAYQFESRQNPEWDKFLKKLNKSTCSKRVRLIKKCLKTIKLHLKEKNIPEGVTYKFKPKTLFVEI